MIDTILIDLKEFGLDFVAKKIKDGYYEFIYYRNIQTDNGRELYEWLFKYNELVTKYYEED